MLYLMIFFYKIIILFYKSLCCTEISSLAVIRRITKHKQTNYVAQSFATNLINVVTVENV